MFDLWAVVTVCIVLVGGIVDELPACGLFGSGIGCCCSSLSLVYLVVWRLV